MRIRQAAEEDAVDNAEDRGRRSDAECEGEHCGGGKDQVAPQISQPVPDVLLQHFQPPPRILFRCIFGGFFHVAKFDAGLSPRIFWGETKFEFSCTRRSKWNFNSSSSSRRLGGEKRCLSFTSALL